MHFPPCSFVYFLVGLEFRCGEGVHWGTLYKNPSILGTGIVWESPRHSFLGQKSYVF